MKLQSATADRPAVQPCDEQSAQGRHQLVRVGWEAVRRIEAGVEARVQLGEILLDAPPGIGRAGIFDGQRDE